MEEGSSVVRWVKRLSPDLGHDLRGRGRQGGYCETEPRMGLCAKQEPTSDSLLLPPLARFLI